MAQQLVAVVKHGDLTNVKRLVERSKADVNEADEYGGTALRHAAERNYGTIVDYLLDKGAGVNKQANSGWAALHAAALKGHVNICRSLLGKGADSNLQDKTGRTALISASGYGHLEVVKCLIRGGADAEKACNNGFTPLHTACQEGHVHIAEYLIALGVGVDSKMEDGRTPLHVAAGTNNGGGGHVEVVKFLVGQGANVNNEDSSEQTALLLAAKYGQTSIVKYLIGVGADIKGDSEGRTPLHFACIKGNLNIAKILISSRDFVDNLMPDGRKSNHVAAGNTSREGIPGADGFSEAYGVDIEHKDKHGRTALHCACESNNRNLVELLISLGADVNKRRDNGGTPLHMAALCGKLNIVKCLISKGADIEQRDNGGQDPLFWATWTGQINVVDWLLREESQSSSDINRSDNQGFTLLHYATRRGHTPVVDQLLSHKADINTLTSGGQNCLHLVALICNDTMTGTKNTCMVKLTSALSQIVSKLPSHVCRQAQALFLYLVQKGADADTKDINGMTSLNCIQDAGIRDTISSFLPSVAKDTIDSEATGQQASVQGTNGAIEVTEYILFQISEEIPTDKIDDMGYLLGFNATQITRFKETNYRGPTITSEGTYTMLHDWYEMTSTTDTYEILRKALIQADLAELEERFLH